MVGRRLIAFAAVVVLGAAAAAAYALIDDGDQDVVPDRLQRAGGRASDTVPSPGGGGGPTARCPGTLPGCREVSGRIVYVERVDPDGDGDAHFVLADTAGVTGTGITVVDVRPDLRPQPLPGVGDHLSAAGSVATGSYGQRQIEAVAVGG